MLVSVAYAFTVFYCMGETGNGKFLLGSSLGSLHSIVASSGPAGPVFVKSTTSLLSRLHCCPHYPTLTVPDSGNSRGFAAELRASQLSCLLLCQHETCLHPNAVGVETRSIKDPRAASAAY